MRFPLPKQAVSTFKDTYGDPRDGGTRTHKGTDISAPLGTSVYAVETGTIYERGNNDKDGNFLVLLGQSGIKYRYSHLNTVYKSKGDTVTEGSTIATVGQTGNAEGPHLHFGMTDAAGNSVNPYDSLMSAFNTGVSDYVPDAGGEEQTELDAATLPLVGKIADSWYDVAAVLLGVVMLGIVIYRLVNSGNGAAIAAAAVEAAGVAV